MTTHELKTWPEYFEEVFRERKNFEIRKNDRNFKVGDMLKLMEWNPYQEIYTGRFCYREITYILTNRNDFIQLRDMVIMSIK